MDVCYLVRVAVALDMAAKQDGELDNLGQLVLLVFAARTRRAVFNANKKTGNSSGNLFAHGFGFFARVLKGELELLLSWRRIEAADKKAVAKLTDGFVIVVIAFGRSEDKPDPPLP